MFSEHGSVTMALFAVSPNKGMLGERSSERGLRSRSISLALSDSSGSPFQEPGVEPSNARRVWSFPHGSRQAGGGYGNKERDKVGVAD